MPTNSWKIVGNAFGVLALAIVLLFLMATVRYRDEARDIAIEAGRLDAMMDNVGVILGARRFEPDVKPSTPFDSRDYAEQSLARAMIQYDRLLPIACSRRLVRGAICRRAPWPAWMNHRALSDESDQVLRERLNEVSARVVPFWSAFCKSPAGGAGRRSACETE